MDQKLKTARIVVVEDNPADILLIRKALQDAGSDTLLLKIDTDVRTGATVDVMTIGKKAGAQKIHILTGKAESK